MKYLIAIVSFLVFSVANAQDEDYVSLQDRLKSNIFLKVDASNTDCFVGEPIIVTYKLYSALNTESRIVNNPYFEGFDVRDLKGQSGEIASRETVDGVKFDVHTLLKLQLTPRRAGKLTLGSLVVRNRVKLVDAKGNEDPLLNGVEEGYTLNNGYFTLPVSSVPLTVLVTALPGGSPPTASQPNGLVGDFKMDVQLSKKLLAPGEQAELTIMITGRGDFSRIEQPQIAWPKAADVLATKVDEDKTKKEDGSGYKSFTIPFTINAPGKYSIPSVRLSFFDATSTRYKTITNIPLELSVVREDGTTGSLVSNSGQEYDPSYLWIGIAALAIIAVVFILLFRHKKAKRLLQPGPSKPVNVSIRKEAVTDTLSVNQTLQEASANINEVGSSTFNVSLKQGILQYLEARWGLPAHSYSQDLLQQTLTPKAVPLLLQTELVQLIATIDMNIYSGGGTETDRIALLDKARRLLHQI